MSRNGKNNKGGRPKGKKNPATLEKEAVLKVYRERIMRNADILFDSQVSIAQGIQFLFKIEKEWIQTGKNKGFWKNKKPILVEDKEEIRAFLERRLEQGDPQDDSNSGATYYFITTKEPNNFAIDSMLDRAFGKPKADDTVIHLTLPQPILNLNKIMVAPKEMKAADVISSNDSHLQIRESKEAD